MKWARFLPIAAWAIVLAGCSIASARSPLAGDVVSLDLRTIPQRHSELAGRWVEFDAYIVPWTRPRFLVATPGEQQTSPDGERRMMCRGAEGMNLPVFLSAGYGPLSRRVIERPVDRQPRVRIRAIFRDSEYSVPTHWITTRWPGYFDRATIVAVSGEWCDFNDDPRPRSPDPRLR